MTPAGVYSPVSPARIDSRIADVDALARRMDYAFVLPGGFRAHDWIFLAITVLVVILSIALPVYGLVLLFRHL